MNHDNVRRYLLSLAALAEEVAADPRLLPWFLLIVRVVPCASCRRIERLLGAHVQ